MKECVPWALLGSIPSQQLIHSVAALPWTCPWMSRAKMWSDSLTQKQAAATHYSL